MLADKGEVPKGPRSFEKGNLAPWHPCALTLA
jgi:hypothetical protein